MSTSKMKCGGKKSKAKPKKAFLGNLVGGLLGGSKKTGGAVPKNCGGGKTKKKK